MNARVVATSLLSKTINRKHGRTTTGAVTLKVTYDVLLHASC